MICFDLRMGVARTARTQEAGQLITRPALRTLLQTPDPALSAASKPPRPSLAMGTYTELVDYQSP